MSARLVPFFVFFLMGITHALSAEVSTETFAPKIYNISRYEQIWKRSPFIVETVVVDSAGLATKFALVGLVSSGNDIIASLIDRNQPDPTKNRFLLSKLRPDKTRNLELVSGNPDRDIRKSSVLIKQGSEQATLSFATEVLSSINPGVQPGGVAPSSPYMPPMRNATTPGMMTTPLPGGVQPPYPYQNNPSSPSSPSSLLPNGAGNQVPPTPRRIIRPNPINVN